MQTPIRPEPAFDEALADAMLQEQLASLRTVLHLYRLQLQRPQTERAA